jgi:cell division protein FtsB
MKRLIEQRYIVRQNIMTIIGLCLCVYFAWHVIAGERSIFRLMSVERSIAKTSAEYNREHAKREQLEARVIKLRPGSIDPDLLEERARAVLGYARPDERIVILPK